MSIYRIHDSKPCTVGVVVFIVAVIFAAALIWNSEKQRIQSERSKVANLAGDYAHVLQQTIERTISSTYALAALVKQGNGRIPDFAAIGRQMLQFYPGATLQLAPGGVIQSIIPLEGNEGAIGHDIFKDPTQAKEAILAKESGKLTLAGPFSLKQGGVGAVARLPVYLDDIQGQRSFWGFTIVLLRFPETLEPARLSQLITRGFHYELWRLDPNMGQKQVITASSLSPPVKPADQTLVLPNGSWTLSMALGKGWSDPLGLSLKVALGLMFSLMLGYITMLMFKMKGHEIELEQQVLIRTSDLEAEIVERKRSEAKNIRLAAIVASSDDAIIGVHLDGTITSWNRGAEQIFDYTEDEVTAKPLAGLMPPDSHERLMHAYEKVLSGESVTRFETVYRVKNGGQIHLSFTFSPVMNSAGKVVAIATIGSDISERIRSEQVRLENAGISRELEIAQEIQKSFLGVCPTHLSGMLMGCLCVSATHVGGDYYDFFTLKNGIVDVVVADVSGHNVSSALLMTETRSVLHAKVALEHSPADLLVAVNELLYDDLSSSEHQISMFYVRIDIEAGTIVYANAGHPRPLLYRYRDNTFMELDTDGMLMGIFKDVLFEEKNAKLEAGDTLFLYTDGVTETQNAAGDLFGVKRLCAVISSQRDSLPEQIIDAVSQALTTFAGTTAMTDDVSIVVIKSPAPLKVPGNES